MLLRMHRSNGPRQQRELQIANGERELGEGIIKGAARAQTLRSQAVHGTIIIKDIIPK